MELEYKPDFERARSYWDAFWQGAIIDRPCANVRAAMVPQPRGGGGLQPVDGDFAAAVRQFDGYLATHAFLGEAMPAFRPGFGPDQMAAFLGAPLVINPEDHSTSWSLKVVDDWAAFLPLKVEDDNRYFGRMQEFHRVAAAHFSGRCLLSEIDFHSNIDCLEGLRGALKLLYDLIDTPDLVHEAMRQVRSLFARIYGQFLSYGDKDRWGTTSALPFYSRGHFNRIQSDFICLLNPDLFRRFVLPAIEEEARLFGHSCFHLDGPGALVHLDDLLAIPQLHAIQWVPGAGNPPQLEWPELLHRIQAAGKAIILHVTADEARAAHRLYRPERVVYDVSVGSVAEGEALLAWLKAHT